jgi:hypothetical protein
MRCLFFYSYLFPCVAHTSAACLDWFALAIAVKSPQRGTSEDLKRKARAGGNAIKEEKADF